MIRPHHFLPNPQTLADNSFQATELTKSANQIAKMAYKEISQAQVTLESHGINVHMFEDESTKTPDSVFPNNWFSTHSGGHIAIYPMYAKNRRLERRSDIIEMLKQSYRVQDIVDYSGLEQDNIYLEGTGAMVLDHLDRVAYAVQSKRANSLALERFCTHFNYEPMLFDACNNAGESVYHTNVLMCIATEFVLMAPEMIKNNARREEIIQRFQASGRDVIELAESQISHFCGNAIELTTHNGRILALSTTAFNALTAEQTQLIAQSAKLVPIDVSTIELAGGSIRCMIAGIHLSPR
ncbi:amidinotransferase [Colwellia sp. PAMC 21821]|nr:amidinotransferase [Colwellia sp. PAMC 21821]